MAANTTLNINVDFFDRTRGAFKQLETNLKNIGKQADAMGKKLLPASAAAGGALFLAGKKAAEFEKNMGNIATLIDGNSAPAIKKLGDTLKEMGKETGISVDQLSKGSYALVSAGVDAEKAATAVEAASKLAKVGLGDFDQSVSLLAASMNAFATEGLTAEQAAAQLNNAVRSGITDVSQLSQGFGAVAPTVAAAGISFQSFTSAVGAATSVGLPASQAYTSIRAAMAGLTRQNTETIKSFKQISKTTGANITDFKSLIKHTKGDLVKAFKLVSESVDGSDAKLLKILGSTEALGIVTQLSTQSYDTYTQAMNNAGSAVDNLNTKYDQQQQTVSALWDKTVVSFNTAAIALGEKFLPIVSKVLEKVTVLINKFGDLSPTIQAIIVGVLGFVAVSAPLLIVIGKIITIFGVLKTVIIAVKTALFAMSAATVKLTAKVAVMAAAWIAKHTAMAVATLAAYWPLLLIVAVIGAIVAAVIFMWDKIKPILAYLVKELSKPILKAWELWVQFFNFVKNAFMAFWDKNVKPILTWIGEKFGRVFRLMWSIAKFVFSKIAERLMTIRDNVINVFTKIASFIGGVVNRLKSVFATISGYISRPFKSAFNSIARAWNQTIGKLRMDGARLDTIYRRQYDKRPEATNIC